MTRAGSIVLWPLRSMVRFPPLSITDAMGRFASIHWPRPGYCMCCGDWAWLTNETPAYSAYDGAFLCEDCAVDNDDETRTAWAKYYSGCL